MKIVKTLHLHFLIPSIHFHMRTVKFQGGYRGETNPSYEIIRPFIEVKELHLQRSRRVAHLVGDYILLVRE